MYCPGFIIGLVSILLISGGSRESSHQLKAALVQLDRLLEDEKAITARKQTRIEAFRSQLEAVNSDQLRFHLQKCLYEEYARYDLDSALRYAHLEEETARRIGDRTLINAALNDRADRYVISGMYRYAEEVLNKMDIRPDDAPQALVTYYRTLITLHHGLNITNKDPLFKERLDTKEHYYRNLIFSAADTTVLFYHTYMAENEMDSGHPEQARAQLEKYLGTGPTNPDELSILHYCIAKTYQQEDNAEMALTHYAISACMDIKEDVRSSRSLIKTARLAMLQGHTDRAFSYITRAYNNATIADARVCLEEIAGFMPEITSSYDEVSKQRYNGILIIMMLLALLLTASIIILLLIRQYQMRLKHSLVRIKEANELREATLGQYAAMFASHINSLEEYRSSIRVVAKSKDIDEIIQSLRSDDFIDAKRETLLKEFDKTFLSVFPDFVQQLNALLKEDHQIGKSLPEGKLSNELRIFALIRLGVTESADISRFLKKSPSTIYNYRVKLRNASIYPNDEFEKRLMEIGKA
ncbi:MAG: DUF6377 domain-containing protein [Bacteroidales bacterium]|nr:DUF6377 domain-containing protein [Bacteroidales bacterium]